MAVALPAAIADAVYVVRQRRAPLPWPIASFVLGAGAGALGLAYALPNGSSMDDLAGVKIGLGVGLLALGVIEVALGVWALLLPRPADAPAAAPPGPETPAAAPAPPTSATPSWSVVPLVVRSAHGAPALGAALTLTRF